ncbi:ABC transporter ATP-binding protein [Streptomyces europaeiscabiei]|uniref:ABC transporter ATP-binding protein n=1 Tax=Streptomyces europaeiscabiei TaxID=146819 RepID=UPI0029A327D4|nr:ABC transporter ATP-binding protein [Streptomyces europaeiscabiei]MDX2765839.1 ABC transporter ATP-binding protein [Streptomyces europaeiscabiei]MDX3710846.1 ABC transporter ATP-binding protein [Streptomyces europaeiscabiei]MDX3835157.1 ABC transporter ATP-binding protein [Streptomyces europaeiscabiei]MDX3843448.1 ABC transporter ATP-binding protein [Streptomyces europaeiscabiei]
MTILSEAGAPGPAAASVPLLRSTVRHSGPRCTALTLVSVASTAANLSLPVTLGRALDLLLAGDPDGSHWVLWCTGLILAVAALDAVETVIAGTTNARATAWLRHRLVGHVLAVGPRAVGRFGPGDLVARLVGNAAQAGTAPATIAALLAALAGPLGAVVALGLMDLWLVVVFLGGAPLLALVLRTLARDSSACVSRYQRAQGRIAGGLAEAVAGYRTIAAAGTADRTVARVLRPLPELSREGHRMWRVQGLAAARAAAVAPLLQLAVVATAGVLLTRQRLSVGELLAASRYAVLAAGIGVLVGHLSGLIRARAGADRLAELLTEPPTTYGKRLFPPPGQGRPKVDAPDAPSARGRLELCSVTVRRGGRAVLDGVDLVVPGGTTLAVVGRSGAGKSLLAAVAGRLTDPDEGEVRLDGVPLPELDRGELRRAIAHAFERPALLGDSVADTIAFGLSRPSPARIREAARAAHADSFVRRLPDGYATPCADAPLSGGEAQRLGLARAFARESRLLVLDDALSSLDTVTERHIADALVGRPTTGGSRLVIAHRAATAARADAVAWLDGGRVRAVGPHAQLWRLAGYRELFGEGAGGGSTAVGGGIEAEGSAPAATGTGRAGIARDDTAPHGAPGGGGR